MKKIFFAFLMLSLSALIFAEKAPDWLRSPKKVFPADRYMHALGEGKSREQAELSALASLTLSFKAHIAVFNKALEDFTLASEVGRTGFPQRETFLQI